MDAYAGRGDHAVSEPLRHDDPAASRSATSTGCAEAAEVEPGAALVGRLGLGVKRRRRVLDVVVVDVGDRLRVADTRFAQSVRRSLEPPMMRPKVIETPHGML